ncbi:23S ribosomal RNA methyltransferase [Bartonella ancashensis]|uniref:23S ribosomal RNA methyltransferase n=1 Tax=Bartonella ancashensis TaxID=1318743 RepID=A0A0M4M3G9_9HYPH|nr:23S ribosomal RNA methyltransferase [Bartonella ancashensis]
MSLLIVAARLLEIMPILKETKPTCPIYCVPQRIMDDITGFHVHHGMLGIGERKTLPSLQEFLQDLPEKVLIPVLCGISCHKAVGEIFRNAAAFASYGVVVDKDSSDPLDRKAIRSSAGETLKLPYTQGDGIDSIIDTLSDANFHLYTLSPSAPYYLKEAKIMKHMALIFSAKDNNLSAHILQKSESLRIPTAYDFDTLDVTTTSSLALAHFADFDKLN